MCVYSIQLWICHLSQWPSDLRWTHQNFTVPCISYNAFWVFLFSTIICCYSWKRSRNNEVAAFLYSRPVETIKDENIYTQCFGISISTGMNFSTILQMVAVQTLNLKPQKQTLMNTSALSLLASSGRVNTMPKTAVITRFYHGNCKEHISQHPHVFKKFKATQWTRVSS